MKDTKIIDLLEESFAHKPTEGQYDAFKKLELFFESKSDKKNVFVLTGFAGTGKTSTLATIVKVLPKVRLKSVLMAPTGRAAKVMSTYTNRQAFTIHKLIYKQVADPSSGELKFKKQKNYASNTLFIVDEGSMLNNDISIGNSGLLSDLIDFVFSDKSNCLMIIGDIAQLPPVGLTDSPALNPSYLESMFNLEVSFAELQEVTRQSQDSGILFNATALRAKLKDKLPAIHFDTKSFQDIYRMSGEKIEDGLRYAYDKYGIENSIIVCRSNKAAVQYNKYIRHQIHFYESEIEVGDKLMVVRNNYFWLGEDSAAGFLANGDFTEVRKIISFEEKHGLRYAKLSLSLCDYPSQPSFEALVLLDTLHSNFPALPREESMDLYQKVRTEHAYLPNKKEQKKALDQDPYLNALQVKYAYALTCHKSQGGQWDAVFVDHGFVRDGEEDQGYMRWLYTALTRASKELFLLNFNSKYFSN